MKEEGKRYRVKMKVEESGKERVRKSAKGKKKAGRRKKG